MNKSDLDFDLFLISDLERTLSDKTRIHPNGFLYEVKEEVGRISGLKVFIPSNDHNPPHFHVTANNPKIDANFLISDCSIYRKSTGLTSTHIKKIQIWFTQEKIVNGTAVTGKILLESAWNKMRG